MSYISADIILPKELLELVQEYADGRYLYIPKKADNRKSWGTNTGCKIALSQRDREIYQKYCQGTNTKALSEAFFLSPKSIQRIILKEKKNV